MLRFSLGVTRLDKIKNKVIIGTVHVRQLQYRLRESRLKGFDHMQKRQEDCVSKKMLQMELPEKRSRGRINKDLWMR